MEKTKTYVDSAFAGKQKDHFERTVYWFEQFIEHFTEAHAVAAYAHDFIDTVTHLISRHEEGGDAEQDALKDADSVSFFETNAEMFVTKKAPIEGYKKVRVKFDWMFNRISTSGAKVAAEPYYRKWIVELEKLNNLSNY